MRAGCGGLDNKLARRASPNRLSGTGPTVRAKLRLSFGARARNRSSRSLLSSMASAQDKESSRLQAVQELEELLSKVTDLPKGTQNGKIWSTLSQDVRKEDPWEVLNRRCEVLWGENLRDAKTGRLPNIETGKYGLHGVVNYLKRVVGLKKMNAVHGAVMVKLDRLKAEVQYYACVFGDTREHVDISQYVSGTCLRKRSPSRRRRRRRRSHATLWSTHRRSCGLLARARWLTICTHRQVCYPVLYSDGGCHLPLLAAALPGGSTKDKTYKPPRSHPAEDDVDKHVDDPMYDSNGEEYIPTPSDHEDESEVDDEDGDEDGNGAGGSVQRVRKVSHQYLYMSGANLRVVAQT